MITSIHKVHNVKSLRKRGSVTKFLAANTTTRLSIELAFKRSMESYPPLPRKEGSGSITPCLFRGVATIAIIFSLAVFVNQTSLRRRMNPSDDSMGSIASISSLVQVVKIACPECPLGRWVKREIERGTHIDDVKVAKASEDDAANPNCDCGGDGIIFSKNTEWDSEMHSPFSASVWEPTSSPIIIDSRLKYTPPRQTFLDSRTILCNQIEQKCLEELNFARTQPAEYAKKVIKPLLAEFDPETPLIRRMFNGDTYCRLARKEGIDAVKECIDFLENQEKLPPLTPIKILADSARDHAIELATGEIRGGHISKNGDRPSERIQKYCVSAGSTGECVARSVRFGTGYPAEKIARYLIAGYIIDDGIVCEDHHGHACLNARMKDGRQVGNCRGHRHTMFRPVVTLDGIRCKVETGAKFIGISVKPDEIIPGKYRNVMDFATGPFVPVPAVN